MFYSTYYNNLMTFPRLLGKLVGKANIIGINEKNMLNIFNIKSLEITLRIPSDISFEHGFIAMLMLSEKMANNKVVFLLDKNTLSKKRTIKVGLIITINNEMMDNFLFLCCDHSIPKFYDYGIFFHIPYKDNPLAYKINKILSNTLFSFDKDINSYYDYLGELQYDMDFLFRTYFKSELLNKLLISNKGVNFINNINISNLMIIKEAEELSLIDEFELDSEIIKEEEFNIYEETDEDINNEILNLNDEEMKLDELNMVYYEEDKYLEELEEDEEYELDYKD
jgi:hypothetical protein